MADDKSEAAYSREDVKASRNAVLNKIITYVHKKGYRIGWAWYHEIPIAPKTKADLVADQDIIERTLDNIVKSKGTGNLNGIDHLEDDGVFEGDNLIQFEEPANMFKEIKLPNSIYILDEFTIENDKNNYAIFVTANEAGKPFTARSWSEGQLPPHPTMEKLLRFQEDPIAFEQECTDRLICENEMAEDLLKYLKREKEIESAYEDLFDKDGGK